MYEITLRRRMSLMFFPHTQTTDRTELDGQSLTEGASLRGNNRSFCPGSHTASHTDHRDNLWTAYGAALGDILPTLACPAVWAIVALGLATWLFVCKDAARLVAELAIGRLGVVTSN